MTHYLYRFNDAEGQLLYVGESIDPISRAAQHRQTAPWFWRVAAFHISVMDSREDALAAEAAAIKTEGPLFNRKLSIGDRTQAFATEQAIADEHVIAKRPKPPIPLPTYDTLSARRNASMERQSMVLAEQLVRGRALKWVEQLREDLWKVVYDAEAAWAHAEEPATSKHHSRNWPLNREVTWRRFWKKAA